MKISILLNLFLLFATGLMLFAWYTQEPEPAVSPEVHQYNPVPEITGEVSCENNEIYWTVKNRNDQTMRMTAFAIKQNSSVQTHVEIVAGKQWELTTTISEEQKKKSDQEFAYLTVWGDYRLLTEPYYYYEVNVQANGSVDVSECK